MPTCAHHEGRCQDFDDEEVPPPPPPLEHGLSARDVRAGARANAKAAAILGIRPKEEKGTELSPVAASVPPPPPPLEDDDLDEDGSINEKLDVCPCLAACGLADILLALL